MNSLSFLLRANLRISSIPNKSVVTYSAQAAKQNVTHKKKKPINKAMRAYIDRVKKFEENLVVESQEYDTGKRFLANIMGEDPAHFTAKDVNKSIEYLLPSGLFQPLARPEMFPPEETSEKARFDLSGRPFHFLFYTGAPHIYELQFETVKRINRAEKLLEEIYRKGHVPEKEHKLDTVGSEWQNQLELEKTISERISPQNYEQTMVALERLAQHPMSGHFKDFLMKYRKPTSVQLTEMQFPEIKQDSDGRYSVEFSSKRKTAKATVTIRSPGEGKFIINGVDGLLYFNDAIARQQVLFPYQVSGMMEKVDTEVTVEGGGFNGQSGAIRYAASMCLAALVDEQRRLHMQLAGLLKFDPRTRERKKFGKAGARRSYTWLKR